MADMDQRAPGAAPRQDASQLSGFERTLRLWSGFVLFTFVLTHYLNNALGIFGVAAMDAADYWRSAFWATWFGTILLYGSALVHVVLVVKRIVERRTWRMPVREALQICLGLAIPFLVYQHAIGTRWMADFAASNSHYGVTLQRLWPNRIWMQTVLTLVVWVHGIIGIDTFLRAKTWWPKWREPFVICAVLVPLAALAGFISGGREAVARKYPGLEWSADQVAAFDGAARIAYNSLVAFGLGLIALLALRALMRRFGRQVLVRYVGHGDVRLPRGSTLLEASRENGIPHPSLCGGRARCSTCRVLILEGGENLDPPSPVEKALLQRISAPPHVRLACQVRPTAPLTAQILMPVRAGALRPNITHEDAFETGTEVTATVLFVDMRAFTQLTKTQFPYDLVALLNRYIGEVQQAVEAHGGVATMYLTDGMMTVFGLGAERRNGSRAAVRAARAMLRALDTMNRELQAALSIPLRIGIGIHTGPIILARIGDDVRGYHLTALGETVTIASRLEEATKTQLTDCLVSHATLKAAGRGLHPGVRHEINVPGMREPVVAYPIDVSPDAIAGDDDVEVAAT